MQANLTERIYFGDILTIDPEGYFFYQERAYTSAEFDCLFTSSGDWEYSHDKTLKLIVRKYAVEEEDKLRTPEQIADLKLPTVFETPNFNFETSSHVNFVKPQWGELLEKVELASLERRSINTSAL